METPTYSAASTILTMIRDETKIGSNPVATALQNTAMLRVLNDINSQFVHWPYTVGMMGWRFLRRETIIETIAATTLNGAVSSGATSLTLTSGTGWDSPSAALGAGYVKSGANIYDFFTFESRSGASLSTVAGIQEAHSTLEETHKIYALPANFGRARSLFRESNVLLYEFLDEDFRQTPPFGYFMVKSLVGTNYSASFLVFPEDIGALNWKFTYIIAPTTIDETTDSVNAPDGLGRRFLVEKGKEYVWNVLGMENDAAIARGRALDAIQQLSSHWAMSTAQVNQSLSPSF